MRQLRAEGWMHNRARLITAAFLTKHLGLDWRRGRAVVLPLAARRRRAQQLRQLAVGGRHRQRHQARTAGSTRSGRPQRFDPDGGYVRRYVPELKGVEGGAVHQPWRLPDERAARPRLPGPLESHRDEAVWLRPS